jgi:WD40 repeat protein
MRFGGMLLILLSAFWVSTVEAQREAFDFLDAKWQPKGDYIAFETQESIHILNSQLEEIIVLSPEPKPNEMTAAGIMQMAWSSDGTLFAATVFSSASELQSTRLIIWESDTWTIIKELYNAVSSINFSPDSRYIATQAGYGVSIYDLVTETAVNSIEMRPLPIVWNPANVNELAIGISTLNVVRVVNPFTSEIIQELPYYYGVFPSYSPNGRFLAVGRFEENIRVIDVLNTTNYSVVASLPHPRGLHDEVEAIFWLGNDEIGTSSILGEALRWNALTGDEIILPVLAQLSQAYWKSDGSVFLAEGSDENGNPIILIHDGMTGEVLRQIPNNSEN